MNAGRPAGPALGETMEKEAFLRLPEAKRELLLKKGKEAYVRYPFEDITIRFLTGELGIDLTTFYRYFESRDDLLIYAYRDLIGRTRYEDYALVYRFVNVYDDALDNDFFAACMRIGNAHREIRDRLLQVEQDILYPIISRKLRAEKYAGRVRRDVDEDLAAYLFASISFNLFNYFDQCGITDPVLQANMKKYVYYRFFQNGIGVQDSAE